MASWVVVNPVCTTEELHSKHIACFEYTTTKHKTMVCILYVNKIMSCKYIPPWKLTPVLDTNRFNTVQLFYSTVSLDLCLNAPEHWLWWLICPVKNEVLLWHYKTVQFGTIYHETVPNVTLLVLILHHNFFTVCRHPTMISKQ